MIYNNKWVRKFMRRAREVCESTDCGSRNVGCIMVRDKIPLISGYNGPPPGCSNNSHRIEFCKDFVGDIFNQRDVSGGDNEEPFYKDGVVYIPVYKTWASIKMNQESFNLRSKNPEIQKHFEDFVKGKNICPRKLLGLKSGEGLQVCNCNHAEANALAFAARHGIAVNNASCFVYPLSPCQSCAGLLISAGIKEIYCLEMNEYKDVAKIILKEAGVNLFLVKKDLLDLNPNDKALERTDWITHYDFGK